MAMSVLDRGSPAALFAAVAAGAAMKYAAGFMFPKQKKEEYRYVGKVGSIWVYPFKSFKGVNVQNADCTSVGIQWRSFGDRQWAVSTADGVYLTQRQVPKMALIEPVLDGDNIMLKAPGMEPISLQADPPVTDSNISKVTVKADTIRSVDMGDAVADWLCRYFDRTGLRLHYSAPNLEKRDASNAKKLWQNPAKPGDMLALADNCGYMVVSNASLADLNTRLETPVPITNFRANIIVDDCSAFAEDSWSSIRIGDVQLRALDACTRCIFVTVDQSKGVKDKNEEPLKTLKTYRLRDPYGPKPCFGVNFTMDKCGHVKVGDPIYATVS
ncbi:mitochondrial amidoxime-reducing component 1 [Aplysia californica]|uniref:Mitochondrial amidoxime-reducing component 1 n=1 Tax=Aplysia californica TaxID=6500 RepID=A0ABM0JYX4_APLCA|nr:mitochondrial amidoxime-reducing component 1 [Aplysia californica]